MYCLCIVDFVIYMFFSLHVSVHTSSLILMKNTRLCDWQEVWTDAQGELRSIAMVAGGQSVTRPGRRKKLQWPVICWIVEWSNNSRPLTHPSIIKMDHSGILTVWGVAQTCGSVLSTMMFGYCTWKQMQMGWFAIVSNMFCAFACHTQYFNSNSLPKNRYFLF